MKSKLPPTLTKVLNRLATEEMRQETFARCKALRAEYASRALAGEDVSALEYEVQRRIALATIAAMKH